MGRDKFVYVRCTYNVRQRYSCKRYARSYGIRHRDLFPLRTVARGGHQRRYKEFPTDLIRCLPRTLSLRSLLCAANTPGNEIKQVYSARQKFIRLESSHTVLPISVFAVSVADRPWRVKVIPEEAATRTDLRTDRFRRS